MDFTRKHREAIQNRKKREKARRHEEILEAARKVFLDKGFDRATMDEIALEAAVSKPTIYQHFKTKDDLYVSLLVPCAVELEKRLERVYSKTIEGKYDSGVDVIYGIGRSFFSVFLKNPEMFRVFIVANQQIHLDKSIDEKVLADYMSGQTTYNLGVRIIEAAMERDLIKRANTFHVVDILWGALIGILQLAIVDAKDGGSFDQLEDILEFAATLARGSIVAR